jgi:hypothetical protein
MAQKVSAQLESPRAAQKGFYLEFKLVGDSTTTCRCAENWSEIANREVGL